MANVLFLLGNGFDLRLKLPTGYEDFLKYYQNQEPLYVKGKSYTGNTRPLSYYKYQLFEFVDKLKENGDPKWSDLEVVLGRLTSVFDKDVEGFREFYTDLNLSLNMYLQSIEEIHPTSDMLDKFYEDFLHPYNYLSAREQSVFTEKISLLENWYFDVVTFNYTNSFEALSESKLAVNVNLTRKDSRCYAIYRGIKHVRGILGKTDILLGVDNLTQIENEHFREVEDTTDFVLKPQSNANCGFRVDEDFRSLIRQADLICFFGLSLGETDATWWRCIKDRFTSAPHVILLCFHYDNKNRAKFAMDKRPERQVRENILRVLGIEEDEKDYRNRIFIAINTDMFPS